MDRISRVAPWLGLVWLVAASPHAAWAVDDAFVSPTGWNRGQANSTYQEWDNFVSATGDPVNSPDVGMYNPNAPGGAGLNVFDTVGLSFVTSDSNIYSFSSATDVHVTLPNYGLGAWYHTTVIVQTQTISAELDYANMTINGAHALSKSELSRVPYTAPFGFGTVDVVGALSTFQLSGNEFNYTLDLPASGFSSALDRVAVDTITSLTGDANGDGRVDIQDVTLIANNWLKPVATGDVNGDGHVDIQDVTMVASNWLHSAANAPPATLPAAGQTSAVPEPGAWALLLSGATIAPWLVSHHRRRRAQSIVTNSRAGN